MQSIGKLVRKSIAVALVEGPPANSRRPMLAGVTTPKARRTESAERHEMCWHPPNYSGGNLSLVAQRPTSTQKDSVPTTGSKSRPFFELREMFGVGHQVWI